MNRTRSQMRKEIEEWKESGLSIAEYCRQSNIKPTTFHSWKKRCQSISQNSLIPIKPVKEKTPYQQSITLETKGYKITLPQAFSESDLINIIKVLEKCHVS